MTKSGHQQQIARLVVKGREIVIADRALSDIVQLAGGTPLYIYEREAIARRVAELRQQMPASLKLHFAVKANPMPAVLEALVGLVDGFDVASHGELCAALRAGASASDISFAGPGKRVAELHAVITAGAIISIESPGELSRAAACAQECGRSARVILRLNPEFELKRSGLAMVGKASQFGMDVEYAREVLHKRLSPAVDVMGFQIYAGTQSLSALALLECQQQIFALARELAPMLPHGLRYLNIGGGFGIPYFPGDAPLDLAMVGRGLRELELAYTDISASAEVVLELGRYIVGEAGFYVCEVVDIKTSRGQKFAVVNGGMHHHLANSGNLGQILRKNYPVVVGNKMGAGPLETVTVVGPLCTPLDVVGDKLELPSLEPGDLVVILQSGAYGSSASPQGFLGHPPPLEILI